jgi:hypothetical protein
MYPLNEEVHDLMTSQADVKTILKTRVLIAVVTCSKTVKMNFTGKMTTCKESHAE